MFERYGIVHINHTFFVYSSILGHLGCFYNLAMVKSLAMNIGMRFSLQYVVLASLEKVLETVELGHTLGLYLVLGGISTLISIATGML